MKRSRGVSLPRMGWVVLAAPMMWACGPEAQAPAAQEVSQQDEPRDVVSWEEYQRNAARVVDGKELYIVEWDLALTRDELRDRYDRYVAAASTGQDGSESPGRTESPLRVNRVGSSDDIWTWANRYNLRYCVSNAFGTNKTRIVNEMANAAASWEYVADVDFIYDSTQDASCTNANPSVTFAVQPWTAGGACAFFPSGGGCIPRTVVIDIPSLDPAPPTSPNVTTGTVLIHELGHVLGFRHEHSASSLNPCYEDSNWRELTTYDVASTMHYPWCNGVSTSTLNLTYLDAAGAAALYGWHTNANNGDRRYPAAHTNDYTAALQMGQSFLIPFAVTTNFAEGCFLVGNGPTAAHIRYGDGMAGAVLASATSVVDTGVQCGVNASYTWHRANFPGVAMFANSVFTVVFGNGTQTLRMAINIGNPYTSGNMWDSFGGGRSLSPWDGRVRMGRLGPP